MTTPSDSPELVERIAVEVLEEFGPAWEGLSPVAVVESVLRRAALAAPSTPRSEPDGRLLGTIVYDLEEGTEEFIPAGPPICANCQLPVVAKMSHWSDRDMAWSCTRKDKAAPAPRCGAYVDSAGKFMDCTRSECQKWGRCEHSRTLLRAAAPLQEPAARSNREMLDAVLAHNDRQRIAAQFEKEANVFDTIAAGGGGRIDANTARLFADTMRNAAEVVRQEPAAPPAQSTEPDAYERCAQIAETTWDEPYSTIPTNERIAAAIRAGAPSQSQPAAPQEPINLPCATCPHPPSCAEYGACQLTDSAPQEPETREWPSIGDTRRASAPEGWGIVGNPPEAKTLAYGYAYML